MSIFRISYINILLASEFLFSNCLALDESSYVSIYTHIVIVTKFVHEKTPKLSNESRYFLVPPEYHQVDVMKSSKSSGS